MVCREMASWHGKQGTASCLAHRPPAAFFSLSAENGLRDDLACRSGLRFSPVEMPSRHRERTV